MRVEYNVQNKLINLKYIGVQSRSNEFEDQPQQLPTLH